MAQAKRKPKRYSPGYGMPDYATPLLRFITGYKGRGRPKSSDALKTEKRERKLFFVLMDIRLLGLTVVKSFSVVAERLRFKFPDKYPREKKTKDTGKTMVPSLRKDVADALKLLHRNATRVKDQKFLHLLRMYERRQTNLAR
jgi:hypothetical protein